MRAHSSPIVVGSSISERTRLTAAGVGVWVLGFAAVLYLAVRGGGYDAVIRGETGIALWWIALVGCAAGVLGVAGIGRRAWVAVGLLAAFAAWSGLSAIWSESGEGSVAAAGAIATYAGALMLALLVVRPDTRGRLVQGVACAIAVVGGLAVLSRLHPVWFGADETTSFLPSARPRLSYPLNYWNGLAALMAMGLPLLIDQAARARSVVGQAASAGAIPVLVLTIAMTLSRGGALAAGVGLVFAFVLVRPLVAGALTIANAALGSAILVTAYSQRQELGEPVTGPVAQSQADELLIYIAVVCAGVSLIQAGTVLFLRSARRSNRLAVSPRRLAAVLGVVAVVGFVVAGGLGEASRTWQEFKQPSVAGNATSERLSSASGNGRYQYWSSAGDAWAENPLIGIGAGSWELWWARNGDLPGHVLNAHSLLAETLAETGIIGLALLVGFLALLLLGCVRRARRPDDAAGAAGAAGALAAFSVAGAVDWIWQVPVLPIAAVLIAGATLADGSGVASRRARLAVVALAVPALLVIVVPWASTAAIRRSQEDAQANRVTAALSAANDAQSVQPYAATPLLQQALVLEQQGRLAAAARAAQLAERKEPTNWRAPFVRARIESGRGNVAAALRAFRRARSLNKTSSILGRP